MSLASAPKCVTRRLEGRSPTPEVSEVREPSSSSFLAHVCWRETIASPVLRPPPQSPLSAASSPCLSDTFVSSAARLLTVPRAGPSHIHARCRISSPVEALSHFSPHCPPRCRVPQTRHFCVNQFYGPGGTHYQSRTVRSGQYCHQAFLNCYNRK